jgi:hypothetical protein
MPDRPSRVWKDMPIEKRVRAAEAFWRDEDSPDMRVQQMEATVAIAQRLKFRPRSVQALPVERRARHLAHVSDLSDAVATRLLIAYHFSSQRPLMGAFLDALGIAHDNGLITAEDVQPPGRDKLMAAVTTLGATFDPQDVRVYLRTLAALDSETWSNVESVLNG